MKHRDPQRNSPEARPELTPTSSNIKANKNANTSKPPNKESSSRKDEKWSLLRHWNHASHAKRVKWMVGGLIAVATVVAPIISYFQNERHFAAEHRASVVLQKFIPTRHLKPDGQHAWSYVTQIENVSDTPAKGIAVSGCKILPMEPSDEVMSAVTGKVSVEDIQPKSPYMLISQDEEGKVLEIDESIIYGFDLGEAVKSPPPSLIKSVPLYCFGWVAYMDEYDSAPRVTEFCGDIFKTGFDVGSGLFVQHVRLCASHNCQDEACTNYKTIADIFSEKVANKNP